MQTEVLATPARTSLDDALTAVISESADDL